MTKIISYIKKGGSIQYKNILILLLSILLIFTYMGYREKSKFEDSYNENLYTKFNIRYLSEYSTLVEYLSLLDKALQQEELNHVEIQQLENYLLQILSVEHDLNDFYTKHYKDHDENFSKYNREVIILDFLHSHSQLGISSFEAIPYNKATYRLKDSVLERKQALYLPEKIKLIQEIVENYRLKNIEKYKHLQTNQGKDFVKSGIWMELFREIGPSIASVEKSYNFGDHAPNEVIAEEYGYIPDELTRALFPLNPRRGYKLLTGDFGVYLYASTYGHRKEFEVISANRVGNAVTISINTKGPLELGSNSGSFTTLTVLLRGLDPNEMDQLQFKVTDERGVPLPQIKE